jgi:hypothetical protein
MKKFYAFTLAIAIMFALVVSISDLAVAQGKVNIKGGPLKEGDWLKDPAGELNEDHSDNKNWITKWYGPDGNYENNGSFQVSGKRDLIDEGTNGKLTEPKLSTVEGLELTQTIKMAWDKKHGGPRDWTVFELDPADAHHMNRDGPIDNIDTYAICVIDAPKDMTSVMSPAHDDHAQIWINGEKWYNNSRWTGAAQQVDFNIEVQLVKGANIVVYRCGESGGHAYMNLHFDDKTHAAVDIYPDKANDQKSFFDEIAGTLAVDPVGKLATTWADIKRK